MTTALIYHSDYLKHDTGAHPERPERATTIINELKLCPALQGQLKWLEPRTAAPIDILRCHQESHYELVRKACELNAGALDPDTMICPESFQVSLSAAGGVLTAIDTVVSGEAENAFVVVRPPGHHATSERAMGFCLFNNVAIGARYAQHQHNLERVLILDWDVHHGNGTQEIFYTDNSVFYISLHQFPHYPGTGRISEVGEGTGRGYTINVPLPAGISPQDYRVAFNDTLAKLLAKLQPDLILISAGFDSHREDPLGGLMLETEDFVWMTTRLKQIAGEHCQGRIISVLEGGYNLRKLGTIAAAHVQALADVRDDKTQS
ncbi:MAG: histone deacetylase [Acidobacteriota bacterium]